MTKTIGRPKTFEKKDILLIAMNHFWIHGYDNSSLDDLLKVMGIKKSSFYNTFKNKEELLSQTLDLYVEEGLKKAARLKKEKGTKAALLYIVKEQIKNLTTSDNKKGCLLINVGKESFGKYDNLNHKITQELHKATEFYTNLISDAKISKEIKNPLEAKVIANRYLTMRNGLSLMIQAGINKEAIDDIIFSIEELLE